MRLGLGFARQRRDVVPGWLGGGLWGFTASPTPQFAHFGRSTNKAGALASTRNGQALDFDADGNLVTAAGNEPLVLPGLGLSNFRDYTNHIRNARNEGGVASTNTPPTNWALVGSNGLTVEWLDSGSDAFGNYALVRLQGTATGVGQNIRAEQALTIVGAQGELWGVDTRVRVFGGSLNGGGFRVSFNGVNDGGTFIEVVATGSDVTPGAIGAAPVRAFVSGTVANASTTRVQPFWSFRTTVGVAYDVTLKIYETKFVKLPDAFFPGFPILPPVGAPAVSTRLADNTTIPDWQAFVERYSLLDGLTIDGTLNIDRLSAANNRTIFQAGSANEFARLDFTTGNRVRMTLQTLGPELITSTAADTGSWTHSGLTAIAPGVSGINYVQFTLSEALVAAANYLVLCPNNITGGTFFAALNNTGPGVSGLAAANSSVVLAANNTVAALRVGVGAGSPSGSIGPLSVRKIITTTLESGIIGSTGLYDISARFKPGDYALTVSGGVSGDTDASAETLPDAIRTNPAYVGLDIAGSLHWNGNIPELIIGKAAQ